MARLAKADAMSLRRRRQNRDVGRSRGFYAVGQALDQRSAGHNQRYRKECASRTPRLKTRVVTPSCLDEEMVTLADQSSTTQLYDAGGHCDQTRRPTRAVNQR